jgi:hypothetical protein
VKRRIGLVAILVVLLGIPLLLLFDLGATFHKAHSVAAFEQANGTITESQWHMKGAGGGGGRGQPASKVRYEVRLAYHYEVDGRTYDGHRYGLAEPIFHDRESCVGFVSQFPTGKSVTVYYDPHNPSDSVLSHEMGKHVAEKAFWAVVLTVAVTGAVGYTIWYNRRGRKAK